MLQTFINRYCQALAGLMVVSLALMVVMVFGNVVMRYGFNTGITLSEELSRWLFVWMTFLGAVVALNERSHLGTDSLISRLPAGGQKLCLGATYLCMLGVGWLVLRGAWEQMVINWDSSSAVMEVPMAYLYASGVVFAILSAPVLLLNFWRLVSGQMGDDELIGIRESDDMPHGNPHP